MRLVTRFPCPVLGSGHATHSEEGHVLGKDSYSIKNPDSPTQEQGIVVMQEKNYF